MIQIGGKTLKYQPHVMSDPNPDPLGLGEFQFLNNIEEEENNSDEDDLDREVADITLDDDVENDIAEKSLGDVELPRPVPVEVRNPPTQRNPPTKEIRQHKEIVIKENRKERERSKLQLLTLKIHLFMWRVSLTRSTGLRILLEVMN